MNTRFPILLVLALASVTTGSCADNPPAAGKADKSDKVKSDLLPPDKRRVAVELGQHLTRPPTPEPLPADLAHPFNPPGFDLPDRPETPPVGTTGAAVAGGAGVVGGTGVAGGAGGAVRGDDPGAAQRAQPAAGEREKLESLASKLNPTGTILLGGNRLLSFGAKNVKIGAPFTVTSNGQDYVLILVAVDSTTFTVRLGNEETTRSIDPKRK